jgi:hypothetical protein
MVLPSTLKLPKLMGRAALFSPTLLERRVMIMTRRSVVALRRPMYPSCMSLLMLRSKAPPQPLVWLLGMCTIKDGLSRLVALSHFMHCHGVGMLARVLQGT